LPVAGLFWEENTADWWLISQTNRLQCLNGLHGKGAFLERGEQWNVEKNAERNVTYIDILLKPSFRTKYKMLIISNETPVQIIDTLLHRNITNLADDQYISDMISKGNSVGVLDRQPTTGSTRSRWLWLPRSVTRRKRHMTHNLDRFGPRGA
jgi:hypothetical protein